MKLLRVDEITVNFVSLDIAAAYLRAYRRYLTILIGIVTNDGSLADDSTSTFVSLQAGLM